MEVRLRGIVQHYDGGHRYVDVVVTKEHRDIYKRHRMGVDIKVNRGRVKTFIGGLYGIEPGHVVWPHHVEVVDI